jgi:quercetin dioxygenase-like cupin family protein
MQYHDEVMEVLSGKMKFFIEGREIIASAGDVPLTIPRGTVHGFTVIKGEPVGTL